MLLFPYHQCPIVVAKKSKKHKVRNIDLNFRNMQNVLYYLYIYIYNIYQYTYATFKNHTQNAECYALFQFVIQFIVHNLYLIQQDRKDNIKINSIRYNSYRSNFGTRSIRKKEKKIFFFFESNCLYIHCFAFYSKIKTGGHNIEHSRVFVCLQQRTPYRYCRGPGSTFDRYWQRTYCQQNVGIQTSCRRRIRRTV